MSGHENERLSAYLDGELVPRERAEVDAHLAGCARCATALAELGAVDDAAAALPVPAPEGYFDAFPARVMARLETVRAASRARRPPVWTWAAAAALLLAVVTPLTLIQTRSRPGEVSSTRVPATLSDARGDTPRPADQVPRVADRQPRVEAPAPARPSARPAPFQGGPAPTPASVPEPPARSREERAGAETDFARAPAAPATTRFLEEALAQSDAPPAPLTDAAAAAPAGAVASEGLPRRGGLQERVRSAAAQPTVAPVTPAPEGEAAGLLSVGISDARDLERVFRRLDTVRPRSAEEWRRLRDDWRAFAAAHPESLRADEARVRAIEAGYEAWLTGGLAADEVAFRHDVEAYLAREDALQKERVRRLVPESPRRP